MEIRKPDPRTPKETPNPKHRARTGPQILYCPAPSRESPFCGRCGLSFFTFSAKQQKSENRSRDSRINYSSLSFLLAKRLSIVRRSFQTGRVLREPLDVDVFAQGRVQRQ